MNNNNSSIGLGGQSQLKECFNIFCQSKSLQYIPTLFGQSTIYFCLTCCDLYKAQQCCYFCAQVYQESQNNFLDGKNWIQCDLCQKWMHLDCEQYLGINNIMQVIQNDDYKYSCPWCRLNKADEQQLQFINSKRFNRIKKYETKKLKLLKQEKLEEKHNINKDNIYNRKIAGRNSLNGPVQGIDKIIIESVKNRSSLDELLKKYGGYNQCISIDDVNYDISLIKAALSK